MQPSPGDQRPSIRGIDSAALLERVGEDRTSFWEVLREFTDFYAETPVQIHGVIHTCRFNEAKTLITQHLDG